MKVLFADRHLVHEGHSLTVTATAYDGGARITGMIDANKVSDWAGACANSQQELDALADAALETLKRSVEPPIIQSPLARCETSGRVL